MDSMQISKQATAMHFVIFRLFTRLSQQVRYSHGIRRFTIMLQGWRHKFVKNIVIHHYLNRTFWNNLANVKVAIKLYLRGWLYKKVIFITTATQPGTSKLQQVWMSGCVHIACSDLMITSLLQFVNWKLIVIVREQVSQNTSFVQPKPQKRFDAWIW